MIKTTTTAEILEAIFLKFSALLSDTQGTNVSVFDIWKNTFSSDFSPPSNEIFIKIIDISDALISLTQQVDSSTIMKENQKLFAKSTIEIFSPTTVILKLNSYAREYISTITQESCGRLGIIAHSLASEFSQNVLTQNTVDEIIAELSEIYDLLDDENLPLKLRNRLRRHIQAVIWRLKNPDCESIQEAYEEMAKITIIADEMNRLCNPSNENSKMSDIGEKSLNIFKKIRSCIEFGYKIYQEADKIEQVIRPMLNQ
ncbi:hypothetical protein [Acetobacter aceti]|uniref:Uncharacterized protein n=1 Tax=Acetobacter aceti TaxID=435 RepID=A0A6S6PMP4_ACEAC|nr:hypothetical protein [Acetobacter aceti]BCI66002.1 hypothetical protein AAJCM20276_06260 [Acetobacter aceti]